MCQICFGPQWCWSPDIYPLLRVFCAAQWGQIISGIVFNFFSQIFHSIVLTLSIANFWITSWNLEFFKNPRLKWNTYLIFSWNNGFFRENLNANSKWLWPHCVLLLLYFYVVVGHVLDPSCSLYPRYHSRFFVQVGHEIIIFSLKHVIVRPTKIIKDLCKANT